MDEGITPFDGGRKSGVDGNNKVWAIRKKVELKIRKWE